MKNLVYATLGFLAIGLTSCGISASTENIAEEFVKHQLNMQGEAAYQLLSKDDKQYKSLAEFDKMKPEERVLTKGLSDKWEHLTKVESTEIDEKDGKKRVVVTATAPDYVSMIRSQFTLADAFSAMGKKDANDEVIKTLVARVNQAYDSDEDVPLTTKTDTLQLVKEEEGYRVFKNYALPARSKALAEDVKMLIGELKHEEAVNKIKAFNTEYATNQLTKELNELEEELNATTTLNKPITIGSLEFTPIAIKVGKVDVYRKRYRGISQRTMEENYLIMKLKVKNLTKAQVFDPKDFRYYRRDYSQVTDNEQNEMNAISLGYSEYVGEEKSVKLQPGDERVYDVVAQSPVNEDAEHYRWARKFRMSNSQDDVQTLFVSFDKADIQY